MVDAGERQPYKWPPCRRPWWPAAILNDANVCSDVAIFGHKQWLTAPAGRVTEGLPCSAEATEGGMTATGAGHDQHLPSALRG